MGADQKNPQEVKKVDPGRRVIFERGVVDARLFSADGIWWADCCLLDVSAAGAQLRLDRQPVATEFFLALSLGVNPPYRRCSRAWIDGDRMGVMFAEQKAPKRKS
jgi:hypothetical protein